MMRLHKFIKACVCFDIVQEIRDEVMNPIFNFIVKNYK